MKVKEYKELHRTKYKDIEVYVPTNEINCTSVKERGKYYKYSTNSENAEIDFVIQEFFCIGTIVRIFTK